MPSSKQSKSSSATKSTSRPSTKEREMYEDLADAMLSMDRDINSGSEKLRPEDLLFRERPETAADAFMRARSWEIENWFVRQVLLLRKAFYTYGQKIVPQEDNKANRDKLKEYFKKNPLQYINIQRYISEAWREADLNQTLISFWREADKTVPFLLLGERCRYFDPMGFEKLYVKLGYKKGDFGNTKLLSDHEFGGLGYEKFVNRYASGQEILLDERFDEHFLVMTNGYRGEGFGRPDLYSVFRTLSQSESMEVAQTMLALIGRRVNLVHQLGFQLNGQGAGPNASYQKEMSLWTKKRGDALLKWFNGRFGFVETTCNFDHQQKIYYHGDPKFYDGRQWDTIINRLMWWAGPVAFMMMSKTPNPFLLPTLKTAADAIREKMRPHLCYVLNRGAQLPLPVDIKYSNRCFYDMQLAWNMVAQLVKSGPLSLTTALHEADFNPETEKENKEREAKTPKQFLPLYNPDQGGDPNQGKNANGRPPKKDKAGVKPAGKPK